MQKFNSSHQIVVTFRRVLSTFTLFPRPLPKNQTHPINSHILSDLEAIKADTAAIKSDRDSGGWT